MVYYVWYAKRVEYHGPTRGMEDSEEVTITVSEITL